MKIMRRENQQRRVNDNFYYYLAELTWLKINNERLKTEGEEKSLRRIWFQYQENCVFLSNESFDGSVGCCNKSSGLINFAKF